MTLGVNPGSVVKQQAIADLVGCSLSTVQYTLKLQAEGKISVKEGG